MMRLGMASLGKRFLAVASVVTVVTATCFGTVYKANVTVHLDGVDPAGNPSSADGTDVSGKSYKDSRTGIIVQLATGTVTNEYGRPRIFSDRGVVVTDPQDTSKTYTATNDFEVIAAPTANSGQSARATELGVYNPAYAPPPT